MHFDSYAGKCTGSNISGDSVILYGVVSLLFCGSKIKTLVLPLLRRIGERTAEKENRLIDEEKQKTNDRATEKEREGKRFVAVVFVICLGKVAAGVGAAMRGIVFGVLRNIVTRLGFRLWGYFWLIMSYCLGDF